MNMIETPKDAKTRRDVWLKTEAEVLTLASQLSDASNEPDIDDEPSLFPDMEGRTRPAETTVIDRIKSRGLSLTHIRKISRAARPETVERYLGAYRSELGL